MQPREDQMLAHEDVVALVFKELWSFSNYWDMRGYADAQSEHESKAWILFLSIFKFLFLFNW